jgi:hypothetical protein
VIEQNEIPSTDGQSIHTEIIRMGEEVASGEPSQPSCMDARQGSRAGTPCGKPLRLPDDAPPVNSTQESTHVPN